MQRERSIEMVGFTHYWERSRSVRWLVQGKSARSRFTRSLRRFNAWCRRNVDQTVAEKRTVLNLRLRGHDAYFGITGNVKALMRQRFYVTRCWKKWLSRRS